MIGVVVGAVLLLWGKEQVYSSQILGQNYRYNLVVASSGGEVEFLSFDPEEKEIVVLDWPRDLMISSRSVGSYKIGDLYKLGSYEGKSGEFTRQKVQGFMKVPIMSYIELEGEKADYKKGLWRVILQGSKVSSVERLDALLMLLRSAGYVEKRVEKEELTRAGVLTTNERDEYEYQEGRLQQFLGKRVLDWGVGEEGLGVAVINKSGIVGLASDVSSFFGNTGLSVIAVRGDTGQEEDVRVTLSNELTEEQAGRMQKLLYSWFGWENIVRGDTSEYRAEIVVELGRSAEELF